MDSLFELQAILLDQFHQQRFYHREQFDKINLDNSVTGILGMRGVGKTTFLLHTILKESTAGRRALYVSADHIYFLENKLLDLVGQLYKETDVRLLCIDEIHKYPNWQQELKNISDFYLDFKVMFSGSSMIDIIHSKFDLSRRVTLHRLNGFSFREYLAFNEIQEIPKCDLKTLLDQHASLTQEIETSQILQHFKRYLKIGYFPFASRFSDDIQIYQGIENIVQKTIYEDIATLHSIKTPTLLVIEKLFQYIVCSEPGELSAYKLASALSKDYESIVTYIRYLEQAGLIRTLHRKQVGKAILKNPAKLYPDNANLVYAGLLSQPESTLIGKVRETFVINQLQSAGLQVHYTEQGDFKCEAYTLEVGGKNKTQKQIKNVNNAYILADGILTGLNNKLPLYLLGFLS